MSEKGRVPEGVRGLSARGADTIKKIREKRLKFLDKLNMFMIKYNCLKIKYQIYLWIDKWTENPCVAGSIPAQATIMKNEELSFKT